MTGQAKRTPTGGPAFPVIGPGGKDSDGMTLRDYFAAKVMVRAIEQFKNSDLNDPDGGVFFWSDIDDADKDDHCEWAAKLAYRMADAMLEARK